MAGRGIPRAREVGVPLLLLALALCLGAPAGAAAAPTVIRTGGPSAESDAKVAVIGSDRNLRGRKFRVADRRGKTAFTGTIRNAHGFHRPWRHAFTADFSALRKPGRYTVRAAGRKSRPWTIGPGGDGRLIRKMLRYLRTNRDGNEAALLHGPSHLNDARLPDGSRIDLTGGWMDAGDMIHFTQTTALVTGELQAAARLAPGSAAELGEEADVGVRWLVKAHPAGSDLFVAQVGDERDHLALGFRDPAGDDASGVPGIAVRRAYPGVGSDIAGKAAAALAMAAERGSPAAPREHLIRLAREWYASGRAAARPLRRLPSPSGGFYLSGTWRDDMATGAAALARATGEDEYLDQALEYLAGSKDPNGIGWIDNGTFAAADICGALGAEALGTPDRRRPACGHLFDAARDAAFNGRQDAFGMAGYFTWGTTAENASYGAAAALAARVGRKGARRVAVRARDYMFGLNPWGASFVAGVGPRSPRHLHHWATVFGKGLPDGAVVGGPAPERDIVAERLRPRGLPFARFSTGRAAYEDRRVDYVTSEPAIDYNGVSILLAAALAGG